MEPKNYIDALNETRDKNNELITKIEVLQKVSCPSIINELMKSALEGVRSSLKALDTVRSLVDFGENADTREVP